MPQFVMRDHASTCITARARRQNSSIGLEGLCCFVLRYSVLICYNLNEALEPMSGTPAVLKDQSALNPLSSCAIEESADGREALALAISKHPEIIVTETRLPGINGFELCQLLRRDIATAATPIVVVTGDAFPSAKERAERAGADVVLVKPCLPETLTGEIRRLLARSAELCARTGRTQQSLTATFAEANRLRAQAQESRRQAQSRIFVRLDTMTPPIPAPPLVCPECDLPLNYMRSHVGGVSARHPEQWDYYECSAGCGTFQYRERTRKIRRVS